MRLSYGVHLVSLTVGEVTVVIEDKAEHKDTDQEGSHRLMLQFDACLREFESARGRNRVLELLALGGIRQLYWLLLAEASTEDAATIAQWWQKSAQQHSLGATI